MSITFATMILYKKIMCSSFQMGSSKLPVSWNLKLNEETLFNTDCHSCWHMGSLEEGERTDKGWSYRKAYCNHLSENLLPSCQTSSLTWNRPVRSMETTSFWEPRTLWCWVSPPTPSIMPLAFLHRTKELLCLCHQEFCILRVKDGPMQQTAFTRFEKQRSKNCLG